MRSTQRNQNKSHLFWLNKQIENEDNNSKNIAITEKIACDMMGGNFFLNSRLLRNNQSECAHEK